MLPSLRRTSPPSAWEDAEAYERTGCGGRAGSYAEND
jgi:hypothetical protein